MPFILYLIGVRNSSFVCTHSAVCKTTESIAPCTVVLHSICQLSATSRTIGESMFLSRLIGHCLIPANPLHRDSKRYCLLNFVNRTVGSRPGCPFRLCTPHRPRSWVYAEQTWISPRHWHCRARCRKLLFKEISNRKQYPTR